MFPCFSEVLKEHLHVETNESTKSPRKVKGGHLQFEELKKLELFEGN